MKSLSFDKLTRHREIPGLIKFVQIEHLKMFLGNDVAWRWQSNNCYPKRQGCRCVPDKIAPADNYWSRLIIHNWWVGSRKMYQKLDTVEFLLQQPPAQIISNEWNKKRARPRHFGVANLKPVESWKIKIIFDIIGNNVCINQSEAKG